MLRQFCKDEEVQQYKEAFSYLTPGDVDDNMYGLLSTLNQLPGVSTRFSCRSHAELKPEDTRFYILFACNEAGAQTLQIMFNRLIDQFLNPEFNKRGTLNSKIKASIRWHAMELSYVYLISPTRFFSDNIPTDFDCRYIPGWALSATMFNDTQVDYFIGLLTSVAKNLLKEIPEVECNTTPCPTCKNYALERSWCATCDRKGIVPKI